MKTVVVGVTSGIAAFKTLELIEVLKEENINVVVIMTKSATFMVPPSFFEKASGNKVHIDLFEKGFDYKAILKARRVEHIDVADIADAVVVVPATANTIAKVAHGIADDFLTTVLLATRAPVIISASMNVNMWENPLTQDNVQKLHTQGFHVIEPDEGALACGYTGKGRLADLEKIKDEILRILSKTDALSGKRVIITAGATKEPIDSVRHITNNSSGKMGAALAEVCFRAGASVHVLRAESAVIPRFGISHQTFITASELLKIISKSIFDYDIIFHTAAVGDFSVKGVQAGKIKSKRGVIVTLSPTPKILNVIKSLVPTIKLIGFKAEYGLSEKELVEAALKRLKESKADAIIANDLQGNDRGFEADTNEVIVVLPNGIKKKISLRSKKDSAQEILKFLLDQNIF